EMLMQSHAGEIDILPALPAAWPSGKITGIVARGGFVVNIEWAEGKLTSLKIHSTLGNQLKLKYGEAELSLDTKTGENFNFDRTLQQI
ncbi:MAG: glycoside hydrolase family 95 protein, partial [Prolixibacteraceae bacterium]|nr:glycoside hydrolase family 95 protein [Prolixibacteraceae bacterium]